jgi:hypothetical protein
MPSSIPADWPSIAALAASGVTLQELSDRFGIKLDTIKARSRRGGWKSVAREVKAGREAAAVTAGQMQPQASSGKDVVVATLADLGNKTKLNLAKATANAAEHAATLAGSEVLKDARNIKEVISGSATLHGWAQNGDGGLNQIININLLGTELPMKPVVDVQ